MFESYKAAAIQLNSTPDIDRNLNLAEQAIDQAAQAGALMIALPECTPFLGPEKDLLKNIKQIDTSSRRLFAALARKHGVYICVGGYRPSEEQARVYNCLHCFDPQGSLLVTYDKIHLFDVQVKDGVSYQESRYIKAGQSEPVQLALDQLGRPGLSICYDLRFPELYRQLSAAGSEVLLIPAAFTAYTGQAHWHTLLRARAIENLCYVIAPAQVGLHFGKRESYGHAMIVNPWGEIAAEVKQDANASDASAAESFQPSFCMATIDASRIVDARAQIPGLQNRRM